MEKITSTNNLRNAILLLEAERAESGALLKENFYQTYERFKPVNLIRSAVRDVISAPQLTDDVLGATVGLAAGYLTKKVIGGKEDGTRRLIGSILGNGVTNLVAQHPESIKSIGKFVVSIFSQKSTNSENSNQS